jgi:CheY-like chemotaxis protein
LEGGRPLVLLVEDDPATARLLRAYLHEGGYDIAETARASEVIALAERLRPRAILLDLELGGHDGLVLLEQLKNRESTRDIPVVIESVRDDRQRGLMLGAADYLVKPLDRRTVLRCLTRLMPDAAPGRQPAVLVIDDDPSVAEVLGGILRTAGYRLLTAGRGAEGVEKAIEERPALAIVDLLLPDISGFEVLEALASDERTRQIPVLVLTAADLDDAQRERLRSRVSALAQKGDFTRDAVLAAVARATGKTHAADVVANGAHVLVADDQDLNRELVRTLLERRGYRVSAAEDGAAAVALARKERPHLVLLDLAMPHKDGLAAAREMKADPELAAIPLVALTAMAMRGDEARAREAGFDAYLTKPIVRHELEATVARLLARG